MKDNPIQMLILAVVIAILVIQAVSLVENANNRSVTTIPNPSTVGYVTVSATGTASAVPSQGTIYIDANGKGKTGAAATVNLSLSLSQMNSTIYKYINGNLSLITTTYYNLYNQTNNGYYYPSYGTYNGYVASEQLTVIIPNTQNMSKAIGALSAINGIYISSASATLSDSQTTSLRTAAYSMAIQNATSQAETLTGNAQLSTQNITVGYYNFYPIPYAVGAASSPGVNSSTPVNPQFYSGTSSVTGRITVVFSYNK